MIGWHFRLVLCFCLLLVGFGGNTNALINLFAVGVFMSFTLSQSGMVLHWWRLRDTYKSWRRSMIINGVGAFTTLIVAVVISSTKFLEGGLDRCTIDSTAGSDVHEHQPPLSARGT